MSSGLAADTKDRIKQANDIVDLIGSYMELRRQGSNFVCHCPWHDDHRPSLQVNPARQSWVCWVCDIRGDVFDFVMRREGVEFVEAMRILAERAQESEKITFAWNTVVTDVYGDDVITGLQLEDTTTGEKRDLDVGGLFVAIGHSPNTGFLQGVVDLKDNGYVRTPISWRTETSVPGIFAAGDVMDDYYRQAVTAAGTGCMAALEAERWLAHGGADAHAEEKVAAAD